VCISLCTIVAHNTAQNRPDNFPSYPPDNHHCSDDVYLREGEEWWGSGMVICLEWCANDLRMVQLMPLPPDHLIPSLKSRLVETFWCWLTQVVRETEAIKWRLSVHTDYNDANGLHCWISEPDWQYWPDLAMILHHLPVMQFISGKLTVYFWQVNCLQYRVSLNNIMTYALCNTYTPHKTDESELASYPLHLPSPLTDTFVCGSSWDKTKLFTSYLTPAPRVFLRCPF